MSLRDKTLKKNIPIFHQVHVDKNQLQPIVDLFLVMTFLSKTTKQAGLNAKEFHFSLGICFSSSIHQPEVRHAVQTTGQMWGFTGFCTVHQSPYMVLTNRFLKSHTIYGLGRFIQLGQQNEFSKIIYCRTFQKISLQQMDSRALLLLNTGIFAKKGHYTFFIYLWRKLFVHHHKSKIGQDSFYNQYKFLIVRYHFFRF